MFLIAFQHCESLASFFATLVLIELFSLTEFLLLKFPGKFFYWIANRSFLSKVSILRRAIFTFVLPFFGKIIIRSNKNNGEINNKTDVAYAHRLFLWQKLLTNILGSLYYMSFNYSSECSLPRLQSSNNKENSNSTNKNEKGLLESFLEEYICYEVESLVYAKTEKRFAKPVENIGIFEQTLFAISPVQNAGNPTAINSPITLELLSRLTRWFFVRVTLFFGRLVPHFLRLEEKKYIGQEQDCLQMNVFIPYSALHSNNNSDRVEKDNKKNSETEKNENKGDKESKEHEEKKLAVNVFVPGGAAVFGSCHQTMHDARNWSVSENAITFVVSYRLGCLAWLQGLESEGMEANLGLHDVKTSLLFVQRNCRHFFGDRDRICVSGQSFGAIATSSLLVEKEVEGKKRGEEDRVKVKSIYLASAGGSLHVHSKYCGKECGKILQEAIHHVIPSSSSSSSNLMTTTVKEKLERASCNELMDIQFRYERNIDEIYKQFALEVRGLPFTVCVAEDKDNLVCEHPFVKLRELCTNSKLGAEEKKKRLIVGGGGRVLLSFTSSEYVMFTLKHQKKEDMENREAQIKQVERRIRSWATTVLQKEGGENSYDREEHENFVQQEREKMMKKKKKKKKKKIDKENSNNEEEEEEEEEHEDSCLSSPLRREAYVDKVTRELLEVYVRFLDEGQFEERFQAAEPKKQNLHLGRAYTVLCSDWVFRLTAQATADVLLSMKDKSIVDVRLLRVDSAVDLVPSLSSAHCSDIPFLFDTLASFPHLSSSFFIEPKRRMMSSVLRRLVTDLNNNNNSDNLDSVWPEALLSDDPVTTTGTCTTSCSSSSSSSFVSVSDDKFWLLPTQPLYVLKLPFLHTKMMERRYGAQNKKSNQLASDYLTNDFGEDFHERRCINEKFDPILAGLYRMKRDEK